MGDVRACFVPMFLKLFLITVSKNIKNTCLVVI